MAATLIKFIKSAPVSPGVDRAITFRSTLSSIGVWPMCRSNICVCMCVYVCVCACVWACVSRRYVHACGSTRYHVCGQLMEVLAPHTKVRMLGPVCPLWGTSRITLPCQYVIIPTHPRQLTCHIKLPPLSHGKGVVTFHSPKHTHTQTFQPPRRRSTHSLATTNIHRQLAL